MLKNKVAVITGGSSGIGSIRQCRGKEGIMNCSRK